MSENRFSSYEGNKAQEIAKRLPRAGASDCEDPFYREVMKWCVVNYDLVESFSKIMTDEEAFFKCLEQCYDRKDVEAFGLAIAMQLKWLQMK